MLLKRVGGGGQQPPPQADSFAPPPPPAAPNGGYESPPTSGGGYGQDMTRPVMPTAAPAPGTAPTIPGMGMPGVIVDRGKLKDFRNQIVQRIQASIGPNTVLTRDDKTIRELASKFKAIYDQLQISLPQDQQRLLFDEVLAEMVGFGPLETLLSDDTITEIMVNGPNQVYIEQKGKLRESDVIFENDDHVMRVINRIIAPLGRRVDRKWPMVDARLPDGSRVNAIIPPCAIKGPTITIRKFSKKPLTWQDLVRFGSSTEDTMKFLEACVRARLNIVVSGGTGSGKTTLLNVLSGFIPDD